LHSSRTIHRGLAWPRTKIICAQNNCAALENASTIEDDVFVSINDGPGSLAKMQTMTGQIQTAVETQRRQFFLMNLTRSEARSPEAATRAHLNGFRKAGPKT
jgi:predicted transposase YdaD